MANSKNIVLILGLSVILILVLFMFSNPSLTGFVSKDIEKVKELKLNQICTDSGESVWRVHNTNKFILNYSWQIENMDLSGSGVAVEGKSYFDIKVLEKDFKVLLFVNTVLQDSKLYSEKCEAEEDYVLPEVPDSNITLPEVNITLPETNLTNTTLENITIIEINETNLTLDTNITLDTNFSENATFENITESIENITEIVNVTLIEINNSSNETIVVEPIITETPSSSSSSSGGGQSSSSSSGGNSIVSNSSKQNITITPISNVSKVVEVNETSNLTISKPKTNFFTLAGNAVRILDDGEPNYFVIVPILLFLSAIALYFIIRAIRKRKNEV